MMRFSLPIALAFAGSASAELSPSEVTQIFEQRCLMPITAGKHGDPTGLELLEGAEPVGTPGSKQKYKLAEGARLEVQTLKVGLHACGVDVDAATNDDADRIAAAIAPLLGDEFKSLKTPCLSESIRFQFISERAEPNPNGNLLGVLGFAIAVQPLPISQIVTVTESNAPLTRHEEVCDE